MVSFTNSSIQWKVFMKINIFMLLILFISINTEVFSASFNKTLSDAQQGDAIAQCKIGRAHV